MSKAASVDLERNRIQITAPDDASKVRVRLTRKDIQARYGGISRPTVTSWMLKGKLPMAMKIGGRLYWDLAEVEAKEEELQADYREELEERAEKRAKAEAFLVAALQGRLKDP